MGLSLNWKSFSWNTRRRVDSAEVVVQPLLRENAAFNLLYLNHSQAFTLPKRDLHGCHTKVGALGPMAVAVDFRALKARNGTQRYRYMVF
jgi:hypothetical protein